MDSSNKQSQQDKAQGSVASYLARVLASVTGPMPILGGVGLPPVDGRPSRTLIAEDPELLERTRHVRRPHERLMEFWARGGPGPGQLRQMTRSEISAFMRQVELNAKDDVKPPPTFVTPVPKTIATSRFFLTD